MGPTGKTGEARGGQWWGGLGGWNHYNGFKATLNAVTVAAECALLLSGNFEYLDILRSQLLVLLENSETRNDGQLLAPTRYSPDGWHDRSKPPYTWPHPMRMLEPAHLYHASMSLEDYKMIAAIRTGEVERDWNEVPSVGEKNSGETELARFQYYDGMMPDWPEKVLAAEYQLATDAHEAVYSESRDVDALIAENVSPRNPVFTKGLTQVTLGAPQSVYNGGLLRATVRYFDDKRARPGLPRDVAALVDRLGPDIVGVQLVNLSVSETQSLIVQAGAFGEHQFTEVTFEEDDSGAVKTARVDGKHFRVTLPPSTALRFQSGLRRFVNDPSYTFPWHGDTLPIPFH